MLYVQWNNNKQALTTFHVGDKVSPFDQDGISAGVTEVQADGDELDLIRKYSAGLPTSAARVVVWYGDDAKFIAGNWNAWNHLRQKAMEDPQR